MRLSDLGAVLPQTRFMDRSLADFRSRVERKPSHGALWPSKASSHQVKQLALSDSFDSITGIALQTFANLQPEQHSTGVISAVLLRLVPDIGKNKGLATGSSHAARHDTGYD